MRIEAVIITANSSVYSPLLAWIDSTLLNLLLVS